MSSLSVRAVSRAFGGTAVLREVDLEVPAGSTTALLGPSGCGKTTLLRIVAGFERADAGSVAIDDRTVAGPGVDLPPERRRVGYVAQEGALFPHLDVAANVLFGLPRPDRRARRGATELLELVGLDPAVAARFPHQLSGGQQQRVALARALAPRPALVLLDEPFAALDAGLRESTRAAVLDALRAADATAVLVTHDQAEALSSADQVAVLLAGQVRQAGPPAQVYAAPVDLDVARFVGDAVVLPGQVRDGVATTVLGRHPLAGAFAGATAQVLVRPEQLVASSAADAVPATLLERTFYGHDTALTLRLEDGTTVRSRGHDPVEAATGDRVTVRVEGPVRAYPTSS